MQDCLRCPKSSVRQGSSAKNSVVGEAPYLTENGLSERPIWARLQGWTGKSDTKLLVQAKCVANFCLDSCKMLHFQESKSLSHSLPTESMCTSQRHGGRGRRCVSCTVPQGADCWWPRTLLTRCSLACYCSR